MPTRREVCLQSKRTRRRDARETAEVLRLRCASEASPRGDPADAGPAAAGPAAVADGMAAGCPAAAAAADCRAATMLDRGARSPSFGSPTQWRAGAEAEESRRKSSSGTRVAWPQEGDAQKPPLPPIPPALLWLPFGEDGTPNKPPRRECSKDGNWPGLGGPL